jgi:hypothetical protein
MGMTTASQKTRLTRDVPAMASRHFWFVADIISRRVEENKLATTYGEDAKAARHAELEQLARDFAADFRQSNGNFRRDQFLTACGFHA